jgi:DNA-binding NtrC family response regulator
MHDTTQDPTSHRANASSEIEWRVEMEVVFAADLSRVGARADLGPADRPFDGLIIGRDGPELVSPRGRGPLGDPCVSRRQLRISWAPATGAFGVTPCDGARRAHTDWTPNGAPMDANEPGPRLVAIGDRALLLFSVRRAEPPRSTGLLGNSDTMRALRSRVAEVARHGAVALLTGPTGSGKEVVAREIHARSGRPGPFVAVNAAALPPDLVESELFGHLRGAFSGAVVAKTGLFQAASGGTLLLDEMGELPLTLQAKLLRAVELNAIRPVGATSEIEIDARIVAATNRDLAADVESGRFRADLHQRLLGLHVVVPPLASHREDIGLLFVTFLGRHALPEVEARVFRAATSEPPPLPLELFLAMLRHPFHGNVRELERLALDAAARGGEALLRSLGEPRSNGAPSERPEGRVRPSPAELARALARHANVQHRVARELGVPYATLDRWLREAGVLRPRDLSEEDIRRSVAEHGGVDAAARALGVSLRGLKLRMAELGVTG